MSIVLCVTGMHRSGTSLTMGWLQRCGLQIHDGRLEGADAGQPKGHYEDRDFLDLQTQAISAAVPGSRGWVVTEEAQTQGLSLDEAAMRELVQRRNAKYAAWGWKDPRTSLFLEQWKRVIPDMKLLWVWRPCHEIVHSLIKRYLTTGHRQGQYLHVTVRQAIGIWKLTAARGMQYMQRYPQDCLSVRLDQVLKHDAALLAELQRRWGLQLDAVPVSGDFEPKLLNRPPKTSSLAVRWGPRLARIYPGVAALQRQMQAISWTADTQPLTNALASTA